MKLTEPKPTLLERSKDGLFQRPMIPLAAGVAALLAVTAALSDKPPNKAAQASPVAVEAEFNGVTSPDIENHPVLHVDMQPSNSEQLPKPDGVPVFGDGLPDSVIGGQANAFVYSPDDGGAEWSVECKASGFVNLVEPGDTVSGLAADALPRSATEADRARLGLVYEEYAESRFVLDADIIYPGDRINLLARCVETVFDEDGSVSQHWLGQPTSGYEWSDNGEEEVEHVG